MKRCSMCGLEKPFNFRGLCKRCADIEKLIEEIFEKDPFSDKPEKPFAKNVHRLSHDTSKPDLSETNFGNRSRRTDKKSPMAAILSSRLFPALAHYLSKEEKAV